MSINYILTDAKASVFFCLNYLGKLGNALITNVDGYRLRGEVDGGRIEAGVNDNGIESLGDISFETVERSTAEKANKWWSEMKGYDQPPYRLSTDVSFIRLAQDSHFVRVYDNIHSKMKGGWFMLAEDIDGLTPKQIQNKYALQYEPRYIVDITLKKGAIIRFGYANGLYGYEGGGLQFDSIDTKIETFYNERSLKGGNDDTN